MAASFVINARTNYPGAGPVVYPRAGSGAAGVALDVTADLSALAQEWRRFEQDADCTVFQTFDWLSAWQQCIGTPTGVRPAIITGRGEGGTLLFILPLATAGPRLARRLTFLGRDLGDYNAPLLAPDFTAQAEAAFPLLWRRIGALLQARAEHRHDLVVLDKMPERVGAQANPFLQLPCRLNPSGAHVATLPSAWDDFYGARRSSRARKRDRQRQRRLAEFGAVRFTTARTAEEALGILNTLVAQKRFNLRRIGVADIFARTGYVEFFRTVATSACMPAHLGALAVGNTCAATNLGLIFRRTFYHILISYDCGPVSRAGPGVAHLQALMRHAIERGCTAFDFTIGDEAYKQEWTDVTLALHDHVAAASLVGRVAALQFHIGRAVKRRIKQTPLLWHAATRLRSLLGRGRRQALPRAGGSAAEGH